MKLSIFSKLTSVILVLMLLAVIPITQKTTAIFEAAARRSAEEINLNSSLNVAREVETFFISTMEKSKTVASFMLKDLNQSSNPLNPFSDGDIGAMHTIESVLKMDKDLWAIELYKVENKTAVLLKRYAKELNFKAAGKESTVIEKIKKIEKINFADVIFGEVLLQNIIQNKELPLVLMSAPLSKNRLGEVDYFVAAYVAVNKIQSIVSGSGNRHLFVTNYQGQMIVHSNDKYTLERTEFASHPVVLKAVSDSITKKQIRYLYDGTKDFYLAAYTKSPLNLIAVSEISEAAVLSQVKQIKRQSVYISGLIISFMLVLVFLFSMSITNPIEILSEFTQQIKKGNFTVKAKNQIRSSDELGSLAEAFDEMVMGLKERDKVKTLFSKFHGSSVAEEMLEMEVGVKGSNKEVTVFFSDVRGFTAFSEGHTPEEVVMMLNEYFAIMVSIINKNHGIVDKFIGDAIMAVWGAPKSTGDDNYWCVKACLEMRLALASLNETRKKRGQVPIMVGMGVHTGKAISGTIGSEERMEYTVIGDTVNQTSRIESSTKSFGADLLISFEVAEKVKERFKIELAGEAEVKGKALPLKLFKVDGYYDQQGQYIQVKTDFSEYQKEESEKIKVVA